MVYATREEQAVTGLEPGPRGGEGRTLAAVLGAPGCRPVPWAEGSHRAGVGLTGCCGAIGVWQGRAVPPQ